MANVYYDRLINNEYRTTKSSPCLQSFNSNSFTKALNTKHTKQTGGTEFSKHVKIDKNNFDENLLQKKKVLSKNTMRKVLLVIDLEKKM